MTAIDILHAQCAGVASRVDGSLTLRFVTPEMLNSQAGICIGLHGKNVRLTIFPHDTEPKEIVRVDTERTVKSPSARLRACLFILWQQQNVGGSFDDFYCRQMEPLINAVKEQLAP